MWVVGVCIGRVGLYVDHSIRLFRVLYVAYTLRRALIASHPIGSVPYLCTSSDKALLSVYIYKRVLSHIVPNRWGTHWPVFLPPPFSSKIMGGESPRNKTCNGGPRVAPSLNCEESFEKDQYEIGLLSQTRDLWIGCTAARVCCSASDC